MEQYNELDNTYQKCAAIQHFIVFICCTYTGYYYTPPTPAVVNTELKYIYIFFIEKPSSKTYQTRRPPEER